MPNEVESQNQSDQPTATSNEKHQKRLFVVAVSGLGLAALFVWFDRQTWIAMFEPTDRERFERILASFDYEPATIDTTLIVVGNATDDGIPPLSEPRVIG